MSTCISALLTPSAGKRLIARAVASLPTMQKALQNGTVVIIAGTTNGYVAEEILNFIGEGSDFKRNRFFRGVTLPPGTPQTESGRLPDESAFPGDVVIKNGRWIKGKTIFDVVDDLQEGDIILKGANSLEIETRKAGVLIGHPKGGTIGAALQAVVGRRVELVLPVGVEKRVSGSIEEVAALVNAPGVKGPRLLPVSGKVVCELDAIEIITGAEAKLLAGGGVCGAEGSVWIAVTGTGEQISKAAAVISEVQGEPSFRI